jgi:hypothetical protein
MIQAYSSLTGVGKRRPPSVFGKLVGLQSLCARLYGPACKSIEAKDKT